jgi:CRP-like cAMP-binding protein
MGMLEKFVDTLTKEEATLLEKFTVAKEATSGKILIEQGSKDRSLFFLLSGEYDIYQKLEIARAFHAVKIATLKAPVLFGEANLLCNQERNATVLVKSDSKYLELPYENFEMFIEKRPEVAIKIIAHAGSVVAERYAKQRTDIQDKLIADAENLQKGLLWVKKYMGNVQKCSPELAKKLFKI